MRLYLESVEKLIYDKIHSVLEHLKELYNISACKYAESGQIYRCERKVSSSCYYFSCGIVNIAYYTGTASHICDFRIIVAGLVILKVVGSVDKREVREQSFSRYSASQLEQIVVRIALVIVKTVLYLEDMYREDGCFAVAKTCLGSKQNVLYYHSAFGRGVCTVVY